MSKDGLLDGRSDRLYTRAIVHHMSDAVLHDAHQRTVVKNPVKKEGTEGKIAIPKVKDAIEVVIIQIPEHITCTQVQAEESWSTFSLNLKWMEDRE